MLLDFSILDYKGNMSTLLSTSLSNKQTTSVLDTGTGVTCDIEDSR